MTKPLILNVHATVDDKRAALDALAKAAVIILKHRGDKDLEEEMVDSNLLGYVDLTRNRQTRFGD